MTIEVRQMVIKSSFGRDEADTGREPVSADEDRGDDCSDCGGSLGGDDERRRMRAMFMTVFERMRER